MIYTVGWVLGDREKASITEVPEKAWQIAVDERTEIRERRAGAPARTGYAGAAGAGSKKRTSPS